ncbi:MAG: SdpI family protein [Deltaproteobacteria bacterium]|nr:SdpI family protein [Deltaproteobacteria bacterium]
MPQVIPTPVAYPMALIFGGLGLYMLLRRHGPNLWIGVRLPWTCADRDIWDKSWRLAAMFLLGMGVSILLSAKLFFIAVAHLIILGILYPVFLYRRKYGTLRYWKGQGWIDYRPMARCARCGHFQKLASYADLGRGACEACGAKLPEPRAGLRASWPLGAKKDRNFIK